MTPQNEVTRRRVQFSPRVRALLVTSVADYTEHEIHACWFSREESIEIRKEAFDTIHRVSINESLLVQDDENSICLRGLEHYTEQGCIERRSNRRRTWNAVFDEQDRQYDAGECDEHRIADIYSKLTARSQLQACVIGLEDSQECLKSCINNKDATCGIASFDSSSLLTQPSSKAKKPMPWRLGKYHQRFVTGASTRRQLLRVAR